MSCHPVIEQYVTDLSVRLAGPRRWRAGVLDEIRDSLLEGMEAHSDQSGDQTAAALRAVAEHGSVDQVTRAYAPELAVVWARRTGLLALGIIPAMAIVWHLALSVGPPAPWDYPSTGLRLAGIMIGGGVGLTFVCSGAALLGTGRWIRMVSRHLLTLRLAICVASVAVSESVLALLGVVAARAVTAPGSLDWPTVVTAVALSLTAVAGLGLTARRCVTSFRSVPRTPRFSP